jgi:hypothetical protein
MLGLQGQVGQSCGWRELIGSAYDLYDTDETVPVSLITAPVFNTAGDAQWELQIAPFTRGSRPPNATG